MRRKIEEEVISIIEENTQKISEIALHMRIREDLEFDSFDQLMILSGLEEFYRITIPQQDFSELSTIADIVTKLEDYLKNEASA